MEKLEKKIEYRQIKTIVYWSVVLSVMAIVIALYAYIKKEPEQSSSISLAEDVFYQIKKTHKLRVGYGGFPPYTIINLNEKDPNKQVDGYSIDLIKALAAQANPAIELEFVRFSWETIQTELQAGKFDMIADPVYLTVPRALEFDFTMPYAYFGIACGIVKKRDNRFDQFSDLDRPDITISLATGWTSTEYAQKYLTKPRLNLVSVTGDAFNQLDDVMMGRADVALNDVPTVIQYAKAHADKVKAIFIENPPCSVPGGFVVAKGNPELLNFLNASLSILATDGTMEALDKKWEAYHYIPRIELQPGKGLQIK